MRLLLLDEQDTDTIYVAKNKSPLLSWSWGRL